MLTRRLLVAGAAAATVFAVAHTAQAATPTPRPADGFVVTATPTPEPTDEPGPAKTAAGCGAIKNTTLSGSRAHWELICDGGLITVTGWVQDMDADGRCAKVKAVFASGTTEYSEAACPKGVKKNFTWSHPGAIADVYLYEYDV
ncbi:hypothetical protein [Microbispora sp. H10670]|uniref:hypothetical protein n=1 Tax=Microbispora sp. H10670 TaxID=2729108 RepID=UPI001601F1CD|nr:hypothetical protein [Microbispora sp. H10670]